MNKTIGIVVLNYNDYESTINLVNSLLKQQYFVDNVNIVIVDNVSTNESFGILKERFDGVVDVIQSEKNGGYAYGNNFGVKYLHNKYGIKYCAICNPDVVVTGDTFSAMIDELKNNSDNVKVVGCKAIEGDGKVARYCWKMPSVSYELLSSLFIINRLFLKNKNRYNNTQLLNDILFVDVVMGAFFVFEVQAFCEVGMLDEQTFLYYEEQILSTKLKKAGYKLAVLNNKEYVHNHKYTTDVSKRIEDYKRIQKSRGIYLSDYSGCSKRVLIMFDIVNAIGLFERKMFSKIFNKIK